MKKKYSWEQFEIDIKGLSRQIKEPIDYIVGISKGGIIPVGMMAQLMNNSNVYLVAYQGGGLRDNIERKKDFHLDLKNKTILLVDDVADSGKTLKMAKSDLENLGNKVITATLHWKESTELMPDYTISQEKDWIVYPWEID